MTIQLTRSASEIHNENIQRIAGVIPENLKGETLELPPEEQEPEPLERIEQPQEPEPVTQAQPEEDEWAWLDGKPTDEAFDELELEWVGAEQLGKGKFYRKGITMIVGDSQVGKSSLMAEWAMSLDVPVLYIAAEGYITYKTKVEAYRKYHGNESDNVTWINRPVYLKNEELMTQAIDHWKKRGFGLIIFDTLSKISRGFQENSASDMAELLGKLYEIAQACNSAICVIHHTKKDGNGYRGSSSLRDDVDIELQFNKAAEGVNVVNEKQKALKQFDTEFWRAEDVELENGNSDRVWYRGKRTVTVRANTLWLRILKAIYDYGGEGMKNSQIKTATGNAQSTIDRNLREMKDAGLIDNQDKGLPYQLTEKGLAQYVAEVKDSSSFFPDRKEQSSLSQ